MHIPSVLVKFIVKPDAFLNISSKSKSTWDELTLARSASLMEWLINQASFLSLILTILSPTHRLLCSGASLYVLKLLLCSSINIILYYYYLCIQIVHHNIFVVSSVVSVDILPWSLLKLSWNAIFLAFPRSYRHRLAYILVPSSTLCVLCELDL